MFDSLNCLRSSKRNPPWIPWPFIPGESPISKSWRFVKPGGPPSQDASGKWRFWLGSPSLKKVRIIVVTTEKGDNPSYLLNHLTLVIGGFFLLQGKNPSHKKKRFPKHQPKPPIEIWVIAIPTKSSYCLVLSIKKKHIIRYTMYWDAPPFPVAVAFSELYKDPLPKMSDCRW